MLLRRFKLSPFFRWLAILLALFVLGAALQVVSPARVSADDPPASSVYDGVGIPDPMNPSPMPCVGSESVLLVQDNIPWFAPGNQDPLGANVTELTAQNKDFCIINSSQIGTTDLAQFAELILSAAQIQAFYDNLFPGGIVHPALAAYVQQGGILSANLTDNASGPGAGGNWDGRTFIGGLTHTNDFPQDNNIAAPTHPIITGEFGETNGGEILDIANFQDLDGWNFASHGFFTNLPPNTTAVLADSFNRPVLIEYPFGAGRVIATQTTTEWRYAGDFGFLPQNRKLLANEIGYQDSLVVPPCVLTVPLLKQNNPNWASDPYNNICKSSSQAADEISCVPSLTPWTIAEKGCATTSAAMLTKFYDIAVGEDGLPVNPENFDNWLSEHGGYDSLGRLVWGKIDEYTGNVVKFDGFGPNTFDVLNEQLCAANPVIIRVPGHFVVVTGQSGETFTINDPFFDRTTLQDYGNEFLSSRLFVKDPPEESDFSKLEIHAGPQAEIFLTDPQGNSTGFDASSGFIITEIPGSSFGIDSLDDDITGAPGAESRIIFVKTPIGGSYNLDVVGDELSTFFIQVNTWDTEGQSSAVSILSGVTAPGIISSYTLDFSSVPGASPTFVRVASLSSTRDDVNISFDLGLIDNAGIVQSLLSKLDAAEAAFVRSQVITASNNLNAFINGVRAQTGKHIDPDIATLLIQDAEFITGQL